MTDISKEVVNRACSELDNEAISLGFPRHMYADILRAQADRIAELEAQLATAQSKLRSVVSHATGGGSNGEGMSLNEIGVKITAFRNRIWADAQKNAREDALREAAHVARHACLVPPDGGSPTKVEADLCDEAASRILALIKQEPKT